MGTAILVTSSIVQVVVIILISAGQVGQAREPQVEGMELVGVRDAWPGPAGVAQTRHQTLVIWIP